MATYRFVSTWRLPAPVERVWDALQLPGMPWWPNMVRFRPLTPGPTRVGSRSERVTRGALPYTLRYEMTVTHIDPPREMAYTSAGDLVGEGRYVLHPSAGGTEVVFHWNVETTGRWLNLLAPLLKPLFAWNHNRVMADGERALARYLSERSGA